mmetsp:Transcript_27842/g.92562  ORF Transcript_27842/g.92562 Transcript_27842/m.92562 type:complete len:207 (-) Transcript_27842:1981-2601(-)
MHLVVVPQPERSFRPSDSLVAPGCAALCIQGSKPACRSRICCFQVCGVCCDSWAGIRGRGFGGECLAEGGDLGPADPASSHCIPYRPWSPEVYGPLSRASPGHGRLGRWDVGGADPGQGALPHRFLPPAPLRPLRPGRHGAPPEPTAPRRWRAGGGGLAHDGRGLAVARRFGLGLPGRGPRSGRPRGRRKGSCCGPRLGRVVAAGT